MKKALLLAIIVWAAPAGAVEDPQGLETLRALAGRGNVEAQVELGILYEYGFQHADHLVPALAWYMRAAEAGQGDAIKRRDALMAKLKPAEVEQAKQLAPTLVSASPAPPTPDVKATPDVPSSPPAESAAANKPLF